MDALVISKIGSYLEYIFLPKLVQNLRIPRLQCLEMFGHSWLKVLVCKSIYFRKIDKSLYIFAAHYKVPKTDEENLTIDDIYSYPIGAWAHYYFLELCSYGSKDFNPIRQFRRNNNMKVVVFKDDLDQISTDSYFTYFPGLEKYTKNVSLLIKYVRKLGSKIKVDDIIKKIISLDPVEAAGLSNYMDDEMLSALMNTEDKRVHEKILCLNKMNEKFQKYEDLFLETKYWENYIFNVQRHSPKFDKIILEKGRGPHNYTPHFCANNDKETIMNSCYFYTLPESLTECPERLLEKIDKDYSVLVGIGNHFTGREIVPGSIQELILLKTLPHGEKYINELPCPNEETFQNLVKLSSKNFKKDILSKYMLRFGRLVEHEDFFLETGHVNELCNYATKFSFEWPQLYDKCDASSITMIMKYHLKVGTSRNAKLESFISHIYDENLLIDYIKKFGPIENLWKMISSNSLGLKYCNAMNLGPIPELDEYILNFDSMNAPTLEYINKFHGNSISGPIKCICDLFDDPYNGYIDRYYPFRPDCDDDELCDYLHERNITHFAISYDTRITKKRLSTEYIWPDIESKCSHDFYKYYEYFVEYNLYNSITE